MKLLRRLISIILIMIFLIVVFIIYTFTTDLLGSIRKDLRGYIIGAILVMPAYFTATGRIPFITSVFPKDSIKNKKFVIKFERSFLTAIAVVSIVGQFLINNTPKQFHLYYFLIFLLIAILSIAYIFAKVE